MVARDLWISVIPLKLDLTIGAFSISIRNSRSSGGIRERSPSPFSLQFNPKEGKVNWGESGCGVPFITFTSADDALPEEVGYVFPTHPAALPDGVGKSVWILLRQFDLGLLLRCEAWCGRVEKRAILGLGWRSLGSRALRRRCLAGVSSTLT